MARSDPPTPAQGRAAFPSDAAWTAACIAERNRNHARHMADLATLPPRADFNTSGEAAAYGAEAIRDRPGVDYLIEHWFGFVRCSFFYLVPRGMAA